MTPERWSRVEDLFDRAADLPPADRGPFLDAACRTPDGAPDAGLRAEVERLLALDADAPAFFAHLGAGLHAEPPPTEEPLPERVGPWRIVREVGRGGMGVVLEAVRDDGLYEGRAAVKLVRTGLAPGLAARFHAERRILAALDHPGIARLLDAGTLDGGPDGAGRPYLVMEYVDGRPITAWADAHRLPVERRLRLFTAVAEAVQYAHRNLVVHRDLKPGNILVTEDGRVKLLDFGIATLLDDAGGVPGGPHTLDGERLLTPEYAAPEQVRGERATTATDVYALGVLLYELLTGRGPYRLPSRVRHAVERAVLEEPPEPPSAAAGRAEERPPETAAAERGTDPARLRRRLRGDLDTIVGVALRKEPARRYGSAEAFARDVERHLDGLPVEARADGWAYRAGRFVRRHRMPVATAALAVLALVSGLAMALWQRDEARSARDLAQAEEQRAEAVTEFLVGLFESSSPGQSLGDTLTARAVLDRGSARVARELDRQPLLRASLEETLGRVYTELGLYGRADTLLAAALDGRRRALAPGHPAHARALFWQAELAFRQNHVGQADTLLTRALELQRAAVREGTLSASSPELAATLNQLGVMARRKERFDNAERYYAEALALRRAARDTVGVAQTLHDTAIMFYSRGEDEGRAELLRQAASRFRAALLLRLRTLGPRHPDTNNTRANLGLLLSSLGDLDEAERMLRDALATERAVSGPDHPVLASRYSQLAYVTLDRGDLAETERLLRAAITLTRTRGSGSRHTLNYRLRLADVQRRARRFDEALATARDVEDEATGEYASDHPAARTARRAGGRVLVEAGRAAEAEPLLRRALAEADDPRGRALVRRDLGRALAALGRWEEAEPLLVAARDSLAAEALDVDPDLRYEYGEARAALDAARRAHGRR